MEDKKLSLVAQFDDICRLRVSLLDQECVEERMIVFMQEAEKSRVRWLDDRKLISELRSELSQEKKERHCLETTLKNVRFALKKEINEKAALKKENDYYRSNMKRAKELMDEYKDHNTEAKERVLSYLNINRLEPVMENIDSSDNSLSDLDYDKSEDFVEIPSTHVTTKRKSRENRPSNTALKRSRNEDELIAIAQDAQEIAKAVPTRSDFDIATTPLTSGADFRSTPEIKSIQNTPLFSKAKRLSTVSENIQPSEMSRLYQIDRVENRAHSFAMKKSFKPGEKCGVCSLNIGFCNSYYRCLDCRALCHLDCKDKVPLPCIPFVSRDNLGKVGRLTLISDFAPLNSRPCIPALVIHCCSEIEKRGLEEAGLYRIPGSDKEVRELKDKILNSKSGVPVLTSVDVHVLCGVVKLFLKSLDEPLVTRVLWRDFVKAADLEDEEQKSSLLQQAISELPTANRDTLAYLIVHLQRIANSPACKMGNSNLAKVFGPTIVGNSIVHAPPMTLLAETPKQHSVVAELLNISGDYWNKFISQYATATLNQQTTSQARSSASHVSKLRGTSVSTGILTPLRFKTVHNQSKSKTKFKTLIN